MDLIYTDASRIEQGVLKNYDVDFDTTGNKDFQISVGITNNVLKGGFLWYIEGTEYGGKVDKEKIITESSEIHYTGRNARGLLYSKVIEPPKGSDYLVLSGTLQEVITGLISNAGYDDLFVVDASTINVSNYKFDRYIKLYDGIVKLLATYGKIPMFTFKEGKIHIGVYEPVDYTDENEFTQDDVQFIITKSYSDVNHLICLGQGELKDRTVIHLYTDKEGNISTQQTFVGEDEVVEIYENTNAASYDELLKEGTERLKELKNADSFEVTVPDMELKIGDIIGGLETTTNTYVAREIVNVIAKINESNIDLEYKVGEDNTKRKESPNSGGSSSSSSSGGGVYNLPPATEETLGGIKVGNGLDIEEDGLLNVKDGTFALKDHTHSSYANQNAFSNVKVGNTTIAADTTTDTLTIAAGSNVTITPDATNDKLTISASHPTISKSADTTSTASPTAGGTFTAVDSVTTDANGHVTKVNTKTVTMPTSEFEEYSPSDFAEKNHTHNYAGSSSAGGSATSAVKLHTARTLQTNLESTSSASFDGSENVSVGVKGVLPVSNGGTGQTTANAAANEFLESLETQGDTLSTRDYYVGRNSDGGFYKQTMSTLWGLMKGLIKSSLGLTASSYDGKAARAIADESGRVIKETYALKKYYGASTVNVGRKADSTVGENSFAFGIDAEASEAYSVAIGSGVSATDIGDCAIGGGSSASGGHSFAQGWGASASGGFSRSMGHWTTAAHDYQTAIGSWNDNKSTNVFEVGYGTKETPQNVFEVDSSGNAIALTDVQTSNGVSLVNVSEKVDALKVDSALSTTSTNPVQNKVVSNSLNTFGKTFTKSASGQSISAGTLTTYGGITPTLTGRYLIQIAITPATAYNGRIRTLFNSMYAEVQGIGNSNVTHVITVTHKLNANTTYNLGVFLNTANTFSYSVTAVYLGVGV